jgi:hypothetical protein
MHQTQLTPVTSTRCAVAVWQGVFDLPKKLRAAIDRGAYDVAVESFAEVAPLLKKYGHKVRAGWLLGSGARLPEPCCHFLFGASNRCDGIFRDCE